MTDDSDADFREAMSDVAPLRSQRATVTGEQRSSAEPTAAQLARRAQALGETRQEPDSELTLAEVPRVQPHDVIGWKKDGVQEAVFKKLRLGEYAIGAKIDLHGHTVREARAALEKFLRVVAGRGERAVLVAHGRGEHSETPARLKSYVNAWLVASSRVNAFHSAPRRLGGTGATLVLLRKSEKLKEANRERHGLKSDRTL